MMSHELGCPTRSEFRAHKDATEEQVAQFVEGWESYLQQLRNQRGPVSFKRCVLDQSYVTSDAKCWISHRMDQ